MYLFYDDFCFLAVCTMTGQIREVHRADVRQAWELVGRGNRDVPAREGEDG